MATHTVSRSPVNANGAAPAAAPAAAASPGRPAWITVGATSGGGYVTGRTWGAWGGGGGGSSSFFSFFFWTFGSTSAHTDSRKSRSHRFHRRKSLLSSSGGRSYGSLSSPE